MSLLSRSLLSSEEEKIKINQKNINITKEKEEDSMTQHEG